MSVIDHGKWILYVPTPYPENAPKSAVFCKRESDGVDWYDYLYEDVDAQPTGTTKDGLPMFDKGPAKMRRLKLSLAAMTVKGAAVFQPMYNAYIVGAATYDMTRIFPANQYVFEVTDYVGTDPQAYFGGKAYDPATGAFTDAVIVMYRLSRSLIVERINAAGKFNQLKSYLNSHAFASEMWYGSDVIAPTNALILSILAEIGADPTEILAPPQMPPLGGGNV